MCKNCQGHGSGGSLALGAIVGALAGAAAALLLAPKSGEETREDLKNHAAGMRVKANLAGKEARDLKDKAGDHAKKMKDKARHAAHEAKDKLRKPHDEHDA